MGICSFKCMRWKFKQNHHHDNDLSEVIFDSFKIQRCPFFRKSQVFPDEYDGLFVDQYNISTKRTELKIRGLYYADSMNDAIHLVGRGQNACCHCCLVLVPEQKETMLTEGKMTLCRKNAVRLWLVVKIGNIHMRAIPLKRIVCQQMKKSTNGRKVHFSVDHDSIFSFHKICKAVAIIEKNITMFKGSQRLTKIEIESSQFRVVFDHDSILESCTLELSSYRKEPFVCWTVTYFQPSTSRTCSYMLNATSSLDMIFFAAECLIFSYLHNKSEKDFKNNSSLLEFFSCEEVRKKEHNNTNATDFNDMNKHAINKENSYDNSSIQVFSLLSKALQRAIFFKLECLVVSIFGCRDGTMTSVLFTKAKSVRNEVLIKQSDTISICIIFLVQAARNKLKSIECKIWVQRILNQVGNFVIRNGQIHSSKNDSLEIFFSLFGCSLHQLETSTYADWDVSSLIEWNSPNWIALVEKSYVGIIRTCVIGTEYSSGRNVHKNNTKNSDLERYMMCLLRLVGNHNSYSRMIEIRQVTILVFLFFEIFKKLSLELFRALDQALLREDTDNGEYNYSSISFDNENERSRSIQSNQAKRSVKLDQALSNISPISSEDASNESKIFSFDEIAGPFATNLTMNTSNVSEKNSTGATKIPLNRSYSVPEIRTIRKLTNRSCNMHSKDDFFLSTSWEIQPIFFLMNWRTRALAFAIMICVLVRGWRQISVSSMDNKYLLELFRSSLNVLRPLAARIESRENGLNRSFFHIVEIICAGGCNLEEEVLVRILTSSMLKQRLHSSFPFIPLHDEHLSQCEILGSGRFGVVKGLSDKIAVKILPWSCAGEDDATRISRIFTEIYALKLCSEQGMLKLHEYGTYESQFWILTEKCKETLTTWLKKKKFGKFESASKIAGTYILVWARCSLVVSRLHQEGIIHNDIKCDNILVRYSMDPSNLNESLGDALYISDFGEAIIRNGRCPIFSSETRARGTERVQSPEMLLFTKRSQENRSCSVSEAFLSLSFSSDVWSLGCLLHEIVTNKYLFDTHDWPKFFTILCEEKMGELPPTESTSVISQILSNGDNRQNEIEVIDSTKCVQDLMKLCLKRSANDRPTAEYMSTLAFTGAYGLLEYMSEH